MMTGTNQNRSSFFSTVYSFLARLFSRFEPGKVDYPRPYSSIPERNLINERIRDLREEFKDLELERQALDNISTDTSFLSISLPEETESAPLARFEGIPITEVPSLMRLKDDLLRRHEIRLKKVEAQALDLIKVIRGLISDGLLSDAREVFDNLNQVIVEVESKDIREAFKETILFWNNERHKIEAEKIKAEAQKKRLEREIILSEPVQTEVNEDKAVIDGKDAEKQNKYDALLDRIRKNQAAIEPIRTALSRVNTNRSKHHRGIESQLKRMGTLFLYHYTDQRNLASINKYGGLLSYKFMIEHGIDIPVPLGDDTSHNIDKDLHMDDYIKLLPIIDHDAITALKQEHKIVILQIDTAVACMQDSLFAPQSLFSDECLISDDYSVLKGGANQVMILAKTFIPKKYIIDVVDC